MAGQPDVVLEVRGLSKSYGAVKALKQISFEVREGECFGVLGPNGAGKSTLMRALGGGLSVDIGDIFVCGLDMKASRYQIKSLLGIVPEENLLDPDFTAIDNLTLFGECFGHNSMDARNKGLSLMRWLGMEPMAHHLVRELSPAMARRLVLARALVPDPKLLLLDEPSLGFDPESRKIAWDYLRNLKTDKKCTMVLASQNLQEIQNLCDRVAILNHGEVLAMGKPQSLIQETVGSEVVELVCKEHEVNYFSSQLKGKFDLQVFQAGLRVYNANSAELRSYFPKLHVDSLMIRKGTLEDVFFKLSSSEVGEKTFSDAELSL